jgi:hypothetical protein
VPLQAANKLIELFTRQDAGLNGHGLGLVAPCIDCILILRSIHRAPLGMEMRNTPLHIELSRRGKTNTLNNFFANRASGHIMRLQTTHSLGLRGYSHLFGITDWLPLQDLSHLRKSDQSTKDQQI